MRRKTNVSEAIQHIASETGISAQKTREEMERAMLAGLHSQDPQIQARWEKIPCKGSAPTPEELIEYLAACINSKIDPFA